MKTTLTVDVVEERVKTIIVEQLMVDESNVVPDARFVEDLGADSLDLVELVMLLEEAFGIEITETDAERLKTVGDALNYVSASRKDI